MKTHRVSILFVCYTCIVGVVNGYSHDNNYENLDAVRQAYLSDKPVRYVQSNKENRRDVFKDEFENWQGRWLPSREGEPTTPPKILPKSESENMNHVSSNNHISSMGVQSNGCDDGKTNLLLDWDRSSGDYTCYDNKIVPSYSIRPMIYCEQIPKAYSAMHVCMNETIQYDDDIPIYGSHRPVWPVYGEYKYLPKERWLHSLEHGGIVALYHPCANPLEVKRLKTIVTGCLRRHIISPYSLLDEDRPLAILSWGCRITMSYVDPVIVQQFIRKKALRGPEQISEDGLFDDFILKKSEIVTDEDDTTLCPKMQKR